MRTFESLYLGQSPIGEQENRTNFVLDDVCRNVVDREGKVRMVLCDRKPVPAPHIARQGASRGVNAQLVAWPVRCANLVPGEEIMLDRDDSFPALILWFVPTGIDITVGCLHKGAIKVIAFEKHTKVLKVFR